MLSVTYAIIAITVLISVLCFNNRELKYKLTFSPYSAKHHKRWYTVFTHAFVHADYMHLGVNMFVLYSFGYQVATVYGDSYAYGVEADFKLLFGPQSGLFYALLYVGGIAFATLPSFYKHSDNPRYLAVGASGAVSSILFASIMLNPFNSIGMIFLPGIGIPAILFGVLYLIYEAYMDKKGRDNVAHDAHFWGAIYGVLFVIVLKPSTVLNFIDQFKLWISSFGS